MHDKHSRKDDINGHLSLILTEYTPNNARREILPFDSLLPFGPIWIHLPLVPILYFSKSTR